MNIKNDRVGIISAGITIFLWSSAFAFIRVGLKDFGAPQLTLLRFATASLAFLLYAVFTKMTMPAKSDIPAIGFLGLVGISIYHTSLNIGEITVPAGTACFIIATAPGFTALLSSILLGERLDGLGWSGIAVALVGTLIMALGDSKGLQLSTGALLILLSAMCTAFFFVYQKRLLVKYKAIELTAYVTWAGTIPLLIFAPQVASQLSQASIESILSVAYIGIFPAAIAYVTWAVTLSRMPASRASTMLYFNPVLAVFWGYLILREIPTVVQLLGGVVALAGVIMVNAGAETRKEMARQRLSLPGNK